MKRTSFVVRILVIGCVIAASALISSVAIATEIQERAKFALAALKSKTAKLGLPKIEGTEFTGDDEYPVLYFGTTKMNNSNEVVDEVVKEHGGIAALGVRVPSSPPYGLVSTTIKKPDGSRYIGEWLIYGTPSLEEGSPVSGFFPMWEGAYQIYEPIKNASGKVIGAYVVAFLTE